MVSSKGLRKSCIDYQTCNLTTLEQNSCLYVKSDFIYEFSKRIHEIRTSFILVSGDSDYTIPFDLFPDQVSFIRFIENKKIKKWFVQNCVYVHEKIILMPIGMDYHTFHETTPLEQENSLLAIEKVDTELKIYSNCHFSMNTRYGKDRLDAIQSISKELLVLEPNYVHRIESWKHQSKYRFCLSPHGNGLDCHRTWEALILGTIPIVKTSPLDRLYENLPVLIVKEWVDVNESLLLKTHLQFKERTFHLEKLTLNYWIEEMKKQYLYVVCHNGLGDHLFMNGGIRFLTQFYDKIYLFCKELNLKQVQSFYKDTSVVIVPFSYSKFEEEKNELRRRVDEVTDDILVCGLWKSFFSKRITNTKLLNYVSPISTYTIDMGPIVHDNYHFIEDFYKDMGLTLTHFYEGFHIESTRESIQLYENVKNYYIVFIQQKSSDGVVLSIERILEKYLWKEDTLLICNDSNLYNRIPGLEEKFKLVNPFVRNNIIYYKELIQNCDEIHMIDSCFLGLIIPYYKRNQLKAKIIEITIR